MSRLWLSDVVRPTPALASRGAEGPSPDHAPFLRAGMSVLALGGGTASMALESWVSTQLGQATDPHLVSLAALRAMGSHPMVYLAERTIGGILRRPDLYYVRHRERRLVRETEEWLWPVLPTLLAAAARAFSYGSVPVILDWGVADLRIEVPRDDGTTRNKSLPGHVHFVAAHEVWPGDVELEVQDDELMAVRHGGQRYGADRAHVFRWDPEFGSWLGQAARRRAWRDFCMSLSTQVLQTRYFERSVDSPRVVWAPAGTQTIGGEETQILDHMTKLLVMLKGSGVVGLPSTRDANGNKRYELDTLDLPDRKDVWEQALNRYDGGVLKAFLVPPSLGGVEDLAATGAKILDGMLREFIQDLAQFAADGLTQLVRIVHRFNYGEQPKEPPPEVLAYEVPAAIRKLYLEVLRLIGAANRAEAPADWVDVPALLDQLGVPLRTTPLRSSTDSIATPGRPRDSTGDRDQRREDARTEEGEDATGASDDMEAS